MTTERKHALLSPSAAHRWMNCTPSAVLESLKPDSSSEFAAEGTLAHAIAAKKLKTYLCQDTSEEDREIESLKDKYYSGEMEEFTDQYSTTVIGKFNAAKSLIPDARLLIETRIEVDDMEGEIFGTADAIIISDGVMEVIDLKYGKGVMVSAIENEQMMIYAYGALRRFDFEYAIKSVCMTIVQPRLDNVSEFMISSSDLADWGAGKLKKAVDEAIKGKGEQKTGSWCRFCKVKGECRAMALENIGCWAKNDNRLLSHAELGKEVLPKLDMIKNWITAVETSALESALAGNDIPGWKVVEGRSVRKITDSAAVAERLLKIGYGIRDIEKPPELKSITDLEKLVGKKAFAAAVGHFIEKPQGKPTLVPMSDKRAIFNSVEHDFKDVIIENDPA